MAKRRFGSLRALPSGQWQARYRGPDGIERPAPHTFPDKRSAERWLTLKEAEIVRGQWIDPDAGQAHVSEWADRWFASISPHLKMKTRATYASLLKTTILPRFGAMPVAAVKPIMVGEWVAGLTGRGLSPSRVRQSYLLFSQIMRAAVENDLIASSPCRRVRLPRLPETDPHVLTPAEVDRIVAACRAPHHVLVLILAYGGLRIGEAFALRRSSVDLRSANLTVAAELVEVGGRLTFDTPKSHQRRTLRLPAFVVDELRDHLAKRVPADPDALLFVGRTGKPLHYNSWRRTHFDPAVEAAGLVDVTPHDLRATHATWVADAHGVMAAARRLGHSNASVTTRHYARVVDGRDGEVAEEFDRVRTSSRGRRSSGTRPARGSADEIER
jgi:integrase